LSGKGEDVEKFSKPSKKKTSLPRNTTSTCLWLRNRRRLQRAGEDVEEEETAATETGGEERRKRIGAVIRAGKG